jgi:hypothetical protein
MIDKLVAYLRQKGEPASSAELACHVLKMKEAPVGLADKIVQSIAGPVQNILRDERGLWRLVERPVRFDLYPFFAIKAFPTHLGRWQQWTACACAVLDREYSEYKTFPNMAQASAFLVNENKRRPSRPLVLEGFDRQLTQWRLGLRWCSGQDFEQPVLTLRRVAALAFPDEAPATLGDLARLLDTAIYEEAQPELHLQTIALLWQSLWERMQNQGVRSLDDLLAKLLPAVYEMDFSQCAFDERTIVALPPGPGVYIMRDDHHRPFYVGKAKSLLERVRTYFLPKVEPDAKLNAIRARLVHLHIRQTGSELEALLLENKLIKEFAPDLNVQVRVQARKHRQKSRYPRILILPADHDASCALFFLHPDKFLACYYVTDAEADETAAPTIFHKRFSLHQWDNLENEVQDYFFSDREHMNDDPGTEIAVSWLSDNEVETECIDMRTVLSGKEAVRLLQAYLGFSRNGEKRIFY